MIGERLRAARGRARKTLKDVAAACGVSPQAVCKYENDECMPNSKAFVAMCSLLDVSPEWMLDQTPLDFHSTADAPQGKHAKYWVREAVTEMREQGLL